MSGGKPGAVPRRGMHLGVFVETTGRHLAAWRHRDVAQPIFRR